MADPVLLSEHFKRRDVIYLLAVALGMLSCFIGRPDATVPAPDPGRGNLLALMRSITWALTLVALRYVERDRRARAPSGRTGPQSSVDMDPAGRVAGLMDDRRGRNNPDGHSVRSLHDVRVPPRLAAQ